MKITSMKGRQQPSYQLQRKMREDRKWKNINLKFLISSQYNLRYDGMPRANNIIGSKFRKQDKKSTEKLEIFLIK